MSRVSWILQQLLRPARLNNERGSAILGAVAVAAIVGVMSMTIASQINDTNKLSHWPRVRSTMSLVEIQVRSVALSPRSYNCGADTAETASVCTLRPDAFAALAKEVPPIGTVEVQNAALNYTSLRFTARVVFVPNAANEGKALAFAPRDLILDVPPEILQSSTFKCPVATPFFIGFGPNGVARCRALSTTRCAPGQYVSSINPTTLEPICSPAGRLVSCPAGQLVKTFTWNGTNNVSVVCEPRPHPYTVFAFNPVPSIGASASQDADTPNPVPTHPIATAATYSWPVGSPAPAAVTCSAPTPTPAPTPTSTPASTPTPSPTAVAPTPTPTSTYACTRSNGANPPSNFNAGETTGFALMPGAGFGGGVVAIVAYRCMADGSIVPFAGARCDGNDYDNAHCDRPIENFTCPSSVSWPPYSSYCSNDPVALSLYCSDDVDVNHTNHVQAAIPTSVSAGKFRYHCK